MPNFVGLLMQHKWFFLVGAEVFSGCSRALLVLRYWLGLRRAGAAVLGLMLPNEPLVATLGLLDYRRTGESPGYQIVVLAFIVYALTFGKTLAGRVWCAVMVVGFVWSFSYSPHPAAHGDARRDPGFSAKVRCGR